MKGNAILWTLLLTLAMTACGQDMEAPPEEAPPEPEVQEQEQYEEALWESRRIMSEEALEYTNWEENSNGFVLMEREEDGVPFLEFIRLDTPDFSLRINQDLTEAVAVYQGGPCRWNEWRRPMERSMTGTSRQAIAGWCRGTVCHSGWI